MSLTPEQIEMRKTGIGASEAPMVLGESPHGGPIALYLRKLGLAVDVTTPAQEMGNILERGIAEYYARKTESVLAPATTLRHADYPWILATPDFWVNGYSKIVQVKTVGQWMAHHWTDDDDGIPDYVRIQVTQEMDVAHVEQCDVAALICGTDMRIYQVAFDPDLAAAIREPVTSFWFDHIVPRAMPESDGSEDMNELLKRLYPLDRTPLVDATPEMDVVGSALIEARSSARQWSTEQERLEQEMKKLLGTAAGALGSDWTVTWKANKLGVRSFVFKSAYERNAKKSRKAA